MKSYLDIIEIYEGSILHHLCALFGGTLLFLAALNVMRPSTNDTVNILVGLGCALIGILFIIVSLLLNKGSKKNRLSYSYDGVELGEEGIFIEWSDIEKIKITPAPTSGTLLGLALYATDAYKNIYVSLYYKEGADIDIDALLEARRIYINTNKREIYIPVRGFKSSNGRGVKEFEESFINCHKYSDLIKKQLFVNSLPMNIGQFLQLLDYLDEALQTHDCNNEIPLTLAFLNEHGLPDISKWLKEQGAKSDSDVATLRKMIEY